MMTPEDAFARYEAIRHRLPVAHGTGVGREVDSLLDIADQADAFVFDAYGVLNVGDRPVPGARDRIAALRDLGKDVRVLTNAASFTRAQTEEKFARLGFDFSSEEIISSRSVCEDYLATRDRLNWGVMAPLGFQAQDMEIRAQPLDDDPETYGRVDGFVLLSTSDWSASRQAMLTASLIQHPRPVVVANPDLVAPRETGLSEEPGYFAHLIQDARDLRVDYHGKPFPSVYTAVEQRLGGIAKHRIVMVGDTLHTDVLGAQARGWRSILITNHGLFAGLDVKRFIELSGIVPDWIAPSV